MSPEVCLERITCSQYFLFLCQPLTLMAALFLILPLCKAGCWQPYQPRLQRQLHSAIYCASEL